MGSAMVDSGRFPVHWIGFAGCGAVHGTVGPFASLNGWMDRLLLWRDGWLLARDYVFTGVGLGMFPMQYSIYTLLIHVLYLPQPTTSFWIC